MKRILLFAFVLAVAGTGCKKCYKCVVERSNGSTIKINEVYPDSSNTSEWTWGGCDKNYKEEYDGQSATLDTTGNNNGTMRCKLDWQ